ncbi:MAG: hypothetical protein PHG20_09350, partial [Geobacteraceae bacterium]|nr:hypothetical protein [Geobacteraceae bacterium]
MIISACAKMRRARREVQSKRRAADMRRRYSDRRGLTVVTARTPPAIPASGLPVQLPVLDSVRLVCGRAQPRPAVLFVFR